MWDDYDKQVELKELIGKTVAKIENDEEQIKFICEDGSEFLMYHGQDCCESVTVEDICGDLSDLIGSPILRATEDTNENENPGGVAVPKYQDSFTWTFYNIATVKGHVTIRWYGESNGYYSESVDFAKIK